MTQRATRILQTAVMQSGRQKVKGFDGRSGSGMEFYSCETGMYTSSIKCEGLPLLEIFGPAYFAVGKDQNIRSRFIGPKQETAFLAECLKTFDTKKIHSCFDAIPLSSLSLPSDIEYMTDVKKFLTTRIAEFSDEQVSAALKIPVEAGWVTQFQAILEAVRVAKALVKPKRNFARFAVVKTTVPAVTPTPAVAETPTTAVGGAGASS